MPDNPFSDPIIEKIETDIVLSSVVKKPSQNNKKKNNSIFPSNKMIKISKDYDSKIARLPKVPPHPALINTMRMTNKVYFAIEKEIGRHPAERGGILLSVSNDYTITGFIADKAASINRAVYQPDTKFLNNNLEGRNEEFIGIVHSHPPGFCSPSPQDQMAAWSNMTSPGNPHLNAYLMPLVQTIPDTGKFIIIPYIVTCHPKGNGRVKVRQVDLYIID